MANRYRDSLGRFPAKSKVRKICGICEKIFFVHKSFSKRKFCSKPCGYKGRTLRGTFQVGHPDLVPATSRGHSKETRQKISFTQRLKNIRGPQHPNWRGGFRTARKRAMGNWQYKNWRKEVFQRDNYTCTKCGIRGSYVHADHIVPWAQEPKLRYEVSNGRTLCYKCHYFTTFGRLDESSAERWGIPSVYRKEAA